MLSVADSYIDVDLSRSLSCSRRESSINSFCTLLGGKTVISNRTLFTEITATLVAENSAFPGQQFRKVAISGMKITVNYVILKAK